MVLLGSNGAGKSTLLNCLSGKVAPTQGSATVHGYDLATATSTIQRLIGYVPQHDLVWDELSALEHVRLFSRLKGERPNLSDWQDMLTSVHLQSDGSSPVGDFSGGMKRRLSIALASISDPPVVFMDEPTTGIDPLNRRRIWKLIQDLKKNRIVILTTHLMQEADVLGDRITIMESGRIVATGSPLHLKTKYGSGYTFNVILSSADNMTRVMDATSRLIPEASLVASAATALAIGIPTSQIHRIPELTASFEQHEH